MKGKNRKANCKTWFYNRFGNPIADKYHTHLSLESLRKNLNELIQLKIDDVIKNCDIYNTLFTKQVLISNTVLEKEETSKHNHPWRRRK